MSRFNLPAESVVLIGNDKVEVTFYATYQLFNLGDINSLSDIKMLVKGAKGTFKTIPTHKRPALNASIQYYFPTSSTSENETTDSE